jgi:plasmid stabilization system protein ParE
VAVEVVFRPQAEDEALEVRQWYASKRLGLGREFGEELNRIVERIAEGPLQFPRVHGEIRRAVLSRFPYAVYFRVVDVVVVVLAIHGRQHPSRWQRRT